MRCSILACFSLATLLFVNPVLAQAPEANAEQLKALEKKVRELEQQIANQLKTQLGPGAIPGAGAANPFGGPPTSAFGTPRIPSALYKNQFEQQIKAHKARIEQLVKEHGEDSAEVKQARQFLRQLEQQLKLAESGTGLPGLNSPPGIFGGFAAPGQGGLAGTPADQLAKQFQEMLKARQGDSSSQGGIDTIARGRRMVLEGLEIQMKEMAKRIRTEEDDDVKEDLTSELRDLAEMVVGARERIRKRTIRELEERLTKLKKQADEEKGADALVDELLGGGEKDKSDKK